MYVDREKHFMYHIVDIHVPLSPSSITWYWLCRTIMAATAGFMTKSHAGCVPINSDQLLCSTVVASCSSFWLLLLSVLNCPGDLFLPDG